MALGLALALYASLYGLVRWSGLLTRHIEGAVPIAVEPRQYAARHPIFRVVLRHRGSGWAWDGLLGVFLRPAVELEFWLGPTRAEGAWRKVVVDALQARWERRQEEARGTPPSGGR